MHILFGPYRNRTSDSNQELNTGDSDLLLSVFLSVSVHYLVHCRIRELILKASSSNCPFGSNFSIGNLVPNSLVLHSGVHIFTKRVLPLASSGYIFFLTRKINKGRM